MKNRNLFLTTVPAIVSTVACMPSAVRAQSPAEDRAALTQGVAAVYAPGALVGSLTIFDDAHAFTAVTGSVGKERAPVVVASHVGQGHVVAYAHGNFIGAAGLREAGNARLLANVVRWLAGSAAKTPIRVGLMGHEGTADTLKAAGFTVTTVDARDLGVALSGIDVLLPNTDALDNPAAIATLQTWVRGGGGLLVDGLGWGWEQLNPTRQLADASFNRVTIPLAGIGFTGGTTEPTGPNRGFLVDGVGLDSGDAQTALTALEQVSAGRSKFTKPQMAEISRTLSDATDELPEGDTTFLPQLKAVLAKYGAGADGDVVPTKAMPVGLDNPAERIAAVLEARRLARTPVDLIKANPAAASFPGTVPADAPRLTNQTILVDTTVPDWHSTGLYAAPGEIVTVTIPASAAGVGFGVRIGSHKDELWNVDSWWRFPKITLEERIKGTSLRIANPFGGTVYVTVPAKGRGTQLGTISVGVSGGVAQPYFVKGKTSLADWKATIRDNPAPWAELQGDRVILSVPSSVVRQLDDPEALMTYWDSVADAAADLYAIPHERRRQERYCTDIEISAGYMHSGYPIMTGLDVAPTFTNLAILRGAEGKTWGFYHELGHNHQQPDWTWAGMGEVTNNLFSLYGNEKFNAVKPDYSNAHGAIEAKARRVRLIEYLAKGPTPDGETENPWLALTMFIDLRQAFGWEPFTTVFGEYRALAPGDHPKSEMDKHDQFMVRFSKVVGKNLGPYFTAWGLTTSDAARQSIANLPGWMPTDWPTAAEVTAAKANPKKVNNYGY